MTRSVRSGLRNSLDALQTTIRQHLQQLVDTGNVKEGVLPDDRWRNDRPDMFYGISEEGRQFLRDHTLLRAEETVREISAQVETAIEIERYETAPPPEREMLEA